MALEKAGRWWLRGLPQESWLNPRQGQWGRRDVTDFKSYQDDSILSRVRCSYSWRWEDGLANFMCSLWFLVSREMFMVSDSSASGPTPFGYIDVPLRKQGCFSLLHSATFSLSYVSCLHTIYQFSCLHKHTMYLGQNVLFLRTYKSPCLHISHK